MCQGFLLMSVGDFFLAYSQNQLLWWQKSVGVPITCGFIQWGAEGALLPLSPIKLFRDEGTQHSSEPPQDVQDWAPQDSCLWALTMQSEQRFFSLLHFNCLFTKQIPAAQEHLWPNGESHSGWLFGSQERRASSVAEGGKYTMQAGQGALGEQGRLREVFAESSSKGPGTASKLPVLGGKTLYFNVEHRIIWEAPNVCNSMCCHFKGAVSGASCTIF